MILGLRFPLLIEARAVLWHSVVTTPLPVFFSLFHFQLPFPLCFLLPNTPGESEEDLRPLPQLTFGPHLTAHGLYHVPHDGAAFARWCAGSTGEPLVDAGMRELALTGWLSNRMRQIVASYLIHELRCDWRAGAAWFESQLLDFDPYSNQGNWAYIAGRGTDPRGGRRFDIQRQARQHDPDGRYRAAWAAVALPASGA